MSNTFMVLKPILPALCCLLLVACADSDPEACPSGEQSNAAASACAAIVCEGGQLENGACVCPADRVLEKGVCLLSDDPCLGFSCDDGSPCSEDQCVAVDGEATCSFAPANDRESCEGGSFDGICVSGVCRPEEAPPLLCQGVDCSDDNPCTQDPPCDDATGQCPEKVFASIETPCGNGGVCNGAGVCVECTQPDHCEDGNACTEDLCDANSGRCVNPPQGEFAQCDLGRELGVCESGICVEAPDACAENPCATPNSECLVTSCIPTDTSRYCDVENAPSGRSCTADGGAKGQCDGNGQCVTPTLAIGELCRVNNDCTGPRTSRCDSTVTPKRCIPDDGWGLGGDYCTHDNHCDARRDLICDIRKSGGSGVCVQPDGDIGESCARNADCAGDRTSRCDNTVTPTRCIPDDGWGRDGDYCTHDNHCDANRDLICDVSQPGGSGFCREPEGEIGDSCVRNADCAGESTSRCDNTVTPTRCIPDDGWGLEGDYCTHDNHCDAGRDLVCKVSRPGGSGFCREPDGNIGDSCFRNEDCAGEGTSRCDNTVSPTRCIPDDDEGLEGDYCTHDNHCDARRNLKCDVNQSGGSGFCREPDGNIGDSCFRNEDCAGEGTSRCDNTVSPKRCIPDDGLGLKGDYCTHDNHCDARRNLKCDVSRPGGSGFCQ